MDDFADMGNLTGIEENNRRKIGSNGQEIIDQATYHKLTNWFVKSGGIIIRGEEAKRHLEKQHASAAYLMGFNAAYILDEATVSDVLEEMYHAKQDRSNKFGVVVDDVVYNKREIDAQEYLLRMTRKYKSPEPECEATRKCSNITKAV